MRRLATKPISRFGSPSMAGATIPGGRGRKRGTHLEGLARSLRHGGPAEAELIRDLQGRPTFWENGLACGPAVLNSH